MPTDIGFPIITSDFIDRKDYSAKEQQENSESGVALPARH
jgi:hypothetical protein